MFQGGDMNEMSDNAPAGPAGMMPPTERRVPSSTSKQDNARINQHTAATIKALRKASPSDLSARIAQLQWEWDVERLAQATAAGLILTSLLLLDFGLRRPVLSSVLAGLVAGLLLQHALVGWCLPLPLYRKMGFRTSYEIMDELVAVRMLRGDFDSLLAGPGDSSHEARRNDLVDKFVGNITKSGRLLGHL